MYLDNLYLQYPTKQKEFYLGVLFSDNCLLFRYGCLARDAFLKLGLMRLKNRVKLNNTVFVSSSIGRIYSIPLFIIHTI